MCWLIDLQHLGFPGGLNANSNWVWDSLACEIECIQFGVAVLTKIACLANRPSVCHPHQTLKPHLVGVNTLVWKADSHQRMLHPNW